MSTTKPLLFTLLGSIGVAACSSPPNGAVFGMASPAVGVVTLHHTTTTDETISGFLFDNEGTGDVVVTEIRVGLTNGATIDSGALGIGLPAGDQVTYLLDVVDHEVQLADVASLTFTVQGSTEQLEVLTTRQTGLVPATN